MTNYYCKAYNENLLKEFKSKSIDAYYVNRDKFYEVENNLPTNKLILDGVLYRDFNTISTFAFVKNGVQHNFIGPAWYSFDSTRLLITVNWLFHNTHIRICNPTDEENYFKWLTENGIDVNNISPEDEQLILMRYLP